MDAKNMFATRATYLLMRLEYGAGLIVVLVLFFEHVTKVRWLPAVVLFSYIDIIGYIPGAIAFHRSKDHKISRVYYVLYNIMHSMVTQTLVALIWIWISGPEWALLVLPIHLFGDRSLFGNFLKPFGVPFEPHEDPAFARFQSEFALRSQPIGRSQPAGQSADAIAAARRGLETHAERS
jgi:hypothetical protein